MCVCVYFGENCDPPYSCLSLSPSQYWHFVNQTVVSFILPAGWLISFHLLQRFANEWVSVTVFFFGLFDSCMQLLNVCNWMCRKSHLGEIAFSVSFSIPAPDFPALYLVRIEKACVCTFGVFVCIIFIVIPKKWHLHAPDNLQSNNNNKQHNHCNFTCFQRVNTVVLLASNCWLFVCLCFSLCVYVYLPTNSSMYLFFVWLRNFPVKFRLKVTKWTSKCSRFGIKRFDLLINTLKQQQRKKYNSNKKKWVFENCLKCALNFKKKNVFYEISCLSLRR